MTYLGAKEMSELERYQRLEHSSEQALGASWEVTDQMSART